MDSYGEQWRQPGAWAPEYLPHFAILAKCKFTVKNIQIQYKCSQILTIEPQIFMPNPYAASIYG